MKNIPQKDSGQVMIRGYTLIELIVAIGLFAFVMTLVSGAYFLMIGLNREAQSIATGINNLSFALETMTRNIRTGYEYDCGGASDCNVNSFSFRKTSSQPIAYLRSTSSSDCGAAANGGGCIVQVVNGVRSTFTDPSVNVKLLTFAVSGAQKTPGDYLQPYVIMIVSGTVSSGPGKIESFSVETGAAMRGSDI